MGGSMTSPGGSNEPPDLIPKEILYIIFIFFYLYNKNFEYPYLKFFVKPNWNKFEYDP